MYGKRAHEFKGLGFRVLGFRGLGFRAWDPQDECVIGVHSKYLTYR